jgi:methionyl-tRNA formyltransferase
MKVLFMGTPEIAVSCFNALFEKHEVCCVVTKEDKPKGRGGALCCSAVKERALECNVEIVQPKTLKDGKFLSVLEKHKPDVIVVVAFGLILPKYVLDFPKYGCINLHASLLPKYRGPAPVQWCIASGEKVGGITTMLMDEGVDTGDILLTASVEIAPCMTGGMLYDEYCRLGSKLLLETLDALENGKLVPKKQDDSICSYAPMLTKENTRINWDDTPEKIVNLVRALNPYPCAHTTVHGKKLKIFTCYAENIQNGEGGSVLSTEEGLTVSCNGGAVTITELQLEGKKRMSAQDFLRGYKMKRGDKLI